MTGKTPVEDINEDATEMVVGEPKTWAAGVPGVTWEATPVKIPTTFWSENSISSLLEKSEYWLGTQGRLIEPVYKPKGKDN